MLFFNENSNYLGGRSGGSKGGHIGYISCWRWWTNVYNRSVERYVKRAYGHFLWNERLMCERYVWTIICVTWGVKHIVEPLSCNIICIILSNYNFVTSARSIRRMTLSILYSLRFILTIFYAVVSSEPSIVWKWTHTFNATSPLTRCDYLCVRIDHFL